MKRYFVCFFAACLLICALVVPHAFAQMTDPYSYCNQVLIGGQQKSNTAIKPVGYNCATNFLLIGYRPGTVETASQRSTMSVAGYASSRSATLTAGWVLAWQSWTGLPDMLALSTTFRIRNHQTYDVMNRTSRYFSN